MSEVATVDAQRGWKMIARRFAALFAGEGVARAVGFVLVLVLARRLGPDGFGVVTLGLTLVAWFAFVVDSGTELLTVRDIARDPTGSARSRTSARASARLSLFAAVVFVGGRPGVRSICLVHATRRPVRTHVARDRAQPPLDGARGRRLAGVAVGNFASRVSC